MSATENTSEQAGAPDVLRRNYRPLTDRQKELIAAAKTKGQELVELLHDIGGTDKNGTSFASRDLSIAFTHIEDATFRVTKHITA